MQKIKFVLLFALLAFMLIAPAAAEYYSEEITDTYYDTWQSRGYSMAGDDPDPICYLKLWNPDKTAYANVYYIAGTACQELSAAQAAAYQDQEGLAITIYDSKLKTKTIGSGTMSYYVEQISGADGGEHYVDFAIWIDEWDIDTIVADGLDRLYWENSADLYPYFFAGNNANLIYKVDPAYINSNAIPLGMDNVVSGEYAPGTATYTIDAVPHTRYPLVVTAYSGYWSYQYSTDFTAGDLNTLSLDINIPTYYNLTSGGIYDEYTESGTRSYTYFQPLGINITNPFTGEILFRQIGDDDLITWPVTVTIVDISSNSLIGGSNVTFVPLSGDGSPDSKILGSGHGTFYLEDGIYYNVTVSASGFKSVESQPIEYGLVTGPNIFQIQMIPDVAPPVGDKEIVFIVNQYADSSGANYIPVQNALVTINNNETALTTEYGMARFTINMSQTSVPYTVTKSDYISVSGNYAASPGIDIEYIPILMREEGEVITGEPTPIPTKDIRTDNEKAESAFSMIMDNIEALTALGLCVVIIRFVGWIK